ncbi:MAG: hypothetical protein K0S33_849 [Bacteroidetes bacterium]|jgi:hypothetical protein|nr:hypothetical protein [Bacteroidota bacterium]
MEESAPIFEEKQFLGHNKVSIMIRMVLALFCFVGYYWSENPKPIEISGIFIAPYPVSGIPKSGQLFFIMGILILLFSALLVQVLHIKTQVYDTYIVLDGFWNARKVKIDLRNIHTVKKMRYKKNSLRRPVYNLHNRGIIKFFTSGDEFVELRDKDGLVYRIGSQRAGELAKSINKILNNFT